MNGTIETIPGWGWSRNLRLSNGAAELIVTLDVGPRILSYATIGRPSPFHVAADQTGASLEPEWRSRGGHRLWLAPESRALSYAPDNAPVAWEQRDTLSVRLTPPAEAATGFRKQLDVTLDAAGTGATVVHRLTRIGKGPRRVAPWALTVMAPGGVAIVPQPPLGEHPRDLLPNRRLVLWPYTDLSDPRLDFGRKFLALRQDPKGAPGKIGFAHREGWAGYLRQGTLFVKRFAWQPDAAYPDDGCNLEVFTNARMLELESLGPLVTLAPGESVEHTERWELHEGLPERAPARDEAIAALLKNGF